MKQFERYKKSISGQGPVCEKVPLVVQIGRSGGQLLQVAAPASWSLEHLQAFLSEKTGLNSFTLMQNGRSLWRHAFDPNTSFKRLDQILSDYSTLTLVPVAGLPGGSARDRYAADDLRMDDNESQNNTLLSQSHRNEQNHSRAQSSFIEQQQLSSEEQPQQQTRKTVPLSRLDHQENRTQRKDSSREPRKTLTTSQKRNRRKIRETATNEGRSRTPSISRGSSIYIDLTRWRNEIPEDVKQKMKARMMRIQAYKDLDMEQREEVCALFSREQLDKVIQLDDRRGLNLSDTQDCLDALNALPKREKRAIYKKIRDRIAVLDSQQSSKMKQIYNNKTGSLDINASNQSLADWQNCKDDLELLKYCYFGDHVDEKSQADRLRKFFMGRAASNSITLAEGQVAEAADDVQDETKDNDWLFRIVDEFYPKVVPPNDPKRLTKLFEILNGREAMRLLMKLPANSVTSEQVSKRSNVKPQYIDYLNEVREQNIMKDDQILDYLMHDEDWEETLANAAYSQHTFDVLSVEDLSGSFMLRKTKGLHRQHTVKRVNKNPNNRSAIAAAESLRSSQEEQRTVEQSRERLLKELETQHAQQIRTIDVKAFGKFLQCIPVPVQKSRAQNQLNREYRFLTLQGQPEFDPSTIEELEEDDQQLFQQPQVDSEEKCQHQILVKEEQEHTIEEEKKTLDAWVEKNKRRALLYKKVHNKKIDRYINELKIEKKQDQKVVGNNVQKKAFLAFWTYDTEMSEFLCRETTEIDQPIAFKDQNYLSENVHQKTYLYRSQTGEIFWFSKSSRNNQLQIQILSDHQNKPQIKNSPISLGSELHKYLVENEHNKDHSYENPMPTLIQDKESSHDSKICVFTKVERLGEEHQSIPIVYFYDLKSQREIAKVTGASIFLQFVPSSAESEPAKVCFLCDSNAIYEVIDLNFNEEQPGIEPASASLRNRDAKNHKMAWYECEVDFDQDREGTEPQELINKQTLRQEAENIELMQRRSSWGAKLKSRFKLINARVDDSQTSAASVQVIPYQNSKNQTFIALVKHSFDESNRGLRIIELDDQVNIKMTTKPQKEFFMAENRTQSSRDSCVEIDNDKNGKKSFKLYDHSQPKHTKPLATKSIKMKNDDSFQFQQPMIIDQNQLLLSSINEKDGTLTWYSITLDERIMPKKSEISNHLQYQIDFPIMSHLQQDHMNNQLVVTNLAFPDEKKSIFVFDRLRFVVYLDLGKIHAESRICFLARSLDRKKNPIKNNLCIVMMKHEKSFEAPQNDKEEDLDKWQILKINLNKFDHLKNILYEVKKAFLVQFDCSDSVFLDESVAPAILFVTRETIYFTEQTRFYDVRKLAAGVKNQNELVNLGPTRGYNNSFFYVEKSSETYIVCELTLEYRCKERQWIWKTSPIYNSSYGKIIAMELDTGYSKKNDSFWSKKDGTLEVGKQVANQLFLIDSAQNLIKLKQGIADNQYTVVLKISMAHINDISPQLEWLGSCDEPRISISDRSVTIRGQHFIYATGHNSQIQFEDAVSGTVLSSSSVDSTNLQLHEVQKTLANGQSKLQIVLKEQPNSRKCCFVGQKSQRDVLLCCFVPEDKLLVKIRTERKDEHYWSLLDASGVVCKMPGAIKRVLSDQNWTVLYSQAIQYAQTQVMLSSQEKVACFRFNKSGDLVRSSIHVIMNDEVNLVAENLQCSFTGELYFLSLISSEQKMRNKVPVRRNRFSKENNFQYKIFCQTHQSGDTTLTSIILDPKQEARSKNEEESELIICGNYLCWRYSEEPFITLTNVHDLTSRIKNGFVALYDTAITCKVIPLEGLLEKQIKQSDLILISMKACSPLYALHAYPDQHFSEAEILKRSDTLQVTIQSRAIIFDLSKNDIPAIQEIPALHHFFDCQSYVESGISVNKVKKNKLANDDRCFRLAQEIKPNNTGSFYYLTTSADDVESSNVFQGGFRSYSELDLIEMRRLHEQINQNKVIKKVDLQTVYSVFHGDSIFTLFEGQLRLYQQIQSQLDQRVFETQEDYDGEDIENPNLRRLVQILSQKSELIYSKNEQNETVIQCTSVLQRNQIEVHVRDTLYQIANKCPNFSIFDTISDQSSIEIMLESHSPTIVELFNSCFVETKSTRQIRKLEWPTDLQDNNLYFFQSNCAVTDIDCQNVIQQQKEKSLIYNQVRVQKFNLNWLFKQNQSYLTLVQILNHSAKSNDIFETEFVRILLNKFWKLYQKRLFWSMMVPFLFYLIFSNMFIYIFLFNSVEIVDPYKNYYKNGSAILCGICWLIQVYAEVQQRRSSKDTYKQVCVKFFTTLQIFNKNDMIHLTLIFFLLLLNIWGIEEVGLDIVSILAALTLFSLFIKCYEWLRIFEKTAFYIYLIAQTMQDILAFIVLFIASLFLFGFPTLMLNFYSFMDTDLYPRLSGFGLLDSLMNQYYLSLGEFHTDNYTKHPHSPIVFLLFICATLFTQITMLNMLIAIMGDTFERVTENSVGIKRQIKLELMEEYVGFLNFNYTPEDFIFKITVDQEESLDSIDSWEGSIGYIKKINDRHFSEIKANYGKQMDRLEKLEEKVTELATRDVSKQIFSSQSKTIARFDILEASLAPIVDQMKDQMFGETDEQGQRKLASKLQKGLKDQVIYQSLKSVQKASSQHQQIIPSKKKSKENQPEPKEQDESQSESQLGNIFKNSRKEQPSESMQSKHSRIKGKRASAQDKDDGDEYFGSAFDRQDEVDLTGVHELFDQTKKTAEATKRTVETKVGDLVNKFDNSMQANNALVFNLNQLSQQVDQTTISMEERISDLDKKFTTLQVEMSTMNDSVKQILAKLDQR